MRRVKRRGRWAQCGHGGLARPKHWRDAARKPTNDKKQALPASQKPRVMRIIITMRYARRGPQFGGSGDDQTQGEGGWGAGCARAADNWPDLDVHVDRENTRTRDSAENLRHHFTVCVCICVGVWYTMCCPHPLTVCSPWGQRILCCFPVSLGAALTGVAVPCAPVALTRVAAGSQVKGGRHMPSPLAAEFSAAGVRCLGCAVLAHSPSATPFVGGVGS